MSDRIDKLVAEAEFLNDNGCDKCEIVTQLATIAREAEAMCDELALMVADLDAETVGAASTPDGWKGEARNRIATRKAVIHGANFYRRA